MTVSSWPYVDVDTTDVEYSRLYREIAGDNGVVGSLGDSALQVYATSAGMTSRVRVGAMLIRGYMMYVSAEEVLTHDAASASLRYDRVVAELNLSAPSIPQRAVPKVLKGAPGGGIPALTQTDTGVFQISLATIPIPAGDTAIDNADVVDDRTWVGQRTGQWQDNAHRPASPRKYKVGFNESLGAFEYWNGTTWVQMNKVDLASDQVSGTLPLSRGGTGATSAVEARANLLIVAQPTQPAYVANQIWMKTAS